MKQTIEVRAVDLVRRIRDDQAGQLADKSLSDVMGFFNRAAESARKRSGRLRAVRKSAEASKKRLQPARRGRARG